MTEQLDRKDLKIEALRQRLADLSVEHENRAADYRVEITVASAQVNELLRENADLKAQLENLSEPTVDVLEEEEPHVEIQEDTDETN